MACQSWSDLPIDLLIRILHLLELPEALAFRAACQPWRSASAAAAGAPRTRRTPWLVSLAEEPLPGEEPSRGLWDPTDTSKFRNLLDGQKTFQVSFPRGQAVALCGASHGWLIMANELSNLLLYDPFTATLLPLPPITGFSSCIEGVYGGDEGKTLVGYRFSCFGADDGRVYDVQSMGGYFYDKVVLSGNPSTGRAVAMAIHLDGKRLSIARVGGSSWLELSVKRRTLDSYADCVYHRGRFYVLSMKGRLKSWDLGGRKNETIIAEEDNDFFVAIARYLVSAPWGRLLQVRVILDKYQEHCVTVKIDRLDLKGRKMVGLSPAKALRGHAAFLGQNSPGLLSVEKFPELRPDCIYFTTPRLPGDVSERRRNQWKGVKVYDLRSRKLEDAFQSGGGHYGKICPSEVWFTPSL